MEFTASDIVEVFSDPAFVLFTDGRLIAANSAACRLFGRKCSDMVDVSLYSLVSSPSEKLAHYLSLCSRTPDPLPGAITFAVDQAAEARTEGQLLRARDADLLGVLLLVARPKSEASEKFLILNEKIAALSREINERKRAELERDQLLVSERAARQEAERIARIKDDFVATLSHELRTPLNAILGWTQLLRMSSLPQADVAQGLDTIERNAKVQSQLVNDLLDMSRIISGKVRLDVQRVDLTRVIESAVETIRPACEAKGIRLQCILDPLAGPVSGDPGRLQQVLWNLLSNAVKFTPKGGRIQVLLERVNSHVEVSVIDTGQGIKPEFLPHVFERFQQADSSITRQHGGLGLGLAIVRHLVELHGGSVRAKSPGVGQGATFTVSLPLIIVHLEEDARDRLHPAASVESSGIFTPPSLQGISVLVIDDELDALQLMRRLLEQCGCKVVVAASALEGLELLKQERPNVIISDLGMPGVDGYELISRIRLLSASEGRDTPAIALSAFARSEDRRRAMLAGYHLHIAKPVEFPELVAAVANVTGLTRRP